MAWLLLEESESVITKDIDAQPDRAAAIAASAFLERKLGDAIKTKLHRHKPTEDRVFTGYGPLATFSARIDIALLIGVITPHMHKVMRTIKEIRNEFAHEPKPRSFTSERIAALCANLGPPEGAVLPPRPPIEPNKFPAWQHFVRIPKDNRDRYLLNVEVIINMIHIRLFIADKGSAKGLRALDAWIRESWRNSSREKPKQQPLRRRIAAGHGRRRRKHPPQP